MNRPNIIVFFTDQQRWDTCGCYGQPMDITPNLDRMATEGIRFENAFTCQPVCGPARAALQTGKYPEAIGCFRNGCALPEDENTLAKHLSSAGYETGYVGKWHLASERGDPENDYHDSPVPSRRRGGYKDFWMASDVLEFTSHSYDGHMFNRDMERVEFPEGRYRVDVLTDHVIDFLSTRTRENPFFLFVSYIEPHHQNDHNCYEGPHGAKERFKDFAVPGDLVDTEGDWRENYPDYLGCISSLDASLGRIRDRLEDLGMADDTVIIFTSDHGSHFRTRNSEYKRSCHEGCIRIPMVIHGPGLNQGKVISDLVSLINIPPTIMEIAGLTVPDDMHEASLVPLVKNETADWQKEVFLQISESQVGRSIRTERWKYSVRALEQDAEDGRRSDVYVEDFLYDLGNDPNEKNNLVSDPAFSDIRKQLAERLKQRMARAQEKIPEIRPA